MTITYWNKNYYTNPYKSYIKYAIISPANKMSTAEG